MWKPFLVVGPIASILPDLDLIYFYTIDQRQHAHHGYWTHLPFYWTVLGIVALSFIRLLRQERFLPYLMVAEANLFVHFCLDTVVGKIQWFYPISSMDCFLFTIPKIYDRWILNFILHWTFLLEFIPCIVALYLLIRRPRIRRESRRREEPCLTNPIG